MLRAVPLLIGSSGAAARAREDSDGPQGMAAIADAVALRHGAGGDDAQHSVGQSQENPCALTDRPWPMQTSYPRRQPMTPDRLPALARHCTMWQWRRAPKWRQCRVEDGRAEPSHRETVVQATPAADSYRQMLSPPLDRHPPRTSNSIRQSDGGSDAEPALRYPCRVVDLRRDS